MGGATGQALGMAVGAAVGSLAGPAGALAGASFGSSAFGYYEESQANRAQSILDESALRLNQEQARLNAAEKSAVHAQNFRNALATQVSLASMRGGAGSLTRQFGSQAYRTFLQDEEAIKRGMDITEARSQFASAENYARNISRDLRAFSRFSNTAFRGVDLNLFQRGSK